MCKIMLKYEGNNKLKYNKIIKIEIVNCTKGKFFFLNMYHSTPHVQYIIYDICIPSDVQYNILFYNFDLF